MSYEIHAVIVKKPYDLTEAKKIARDIFDRKDDRYYRETDSSYRFRNIPKTKFIKKSFRTKVVNPDVSIVFGKLSK